MSPPAIQTTCCIVGGGPAGVLAGFLLARAGVRTIVLEKHKDFFRDFRGDTIHPSTLQIMHELGLLDAFLKLPHQEVRELHGFVGDRDIKIGDFSHLPTVCKFIALMPQWDFLNFLAEQGRCYPGFDLRMETDATELIVERDRVVGLQAQSLNGAIEIRADLVIGADGRHSTVRERAGLEVMNFGAPIDVLWMRLSKHEGAAQQTAGRFNYGRIFVMLDRGDYWQCAYVIRKGGFDEVRARGLDALRGDIVKIAPLLRDRVDELEDWENVRLLTVAVDRLKQWWRPGLLCIGDSAHAMSPIGGVGINLAVQDAVATANILAQPLRDAALSVEHLAAVQRRRTLPARLTQSLQVFMQDRVISPALGSDKPISAPWLLRLFNELSWLPRIPARVLGMGFRPEHVHSPVMPLAQS